MQKSDSDCCQSVGVKVLPAVARKQAAPSFSKSNKVGCGGGGSQETRSIWKDNPLYWMHKQQYAYMQPSFQQNLSSSDNLIKDTNKIEVDFGKVHRCEVDLRCKQIVERVRLREMLKNNPKTQCPQDQNKSSANQVKVPEKPISTYLEGSPLKNYAKSTDPVIDRSEWLQPRYSFQMTKEPTEEVMFVDFQKEERCRLQQLCKDAEKGKIKLLHAPKPPPEKESRQVSESPCNKSPAQVYCCNDPTKKPEK